MHSPGPMIAPHALTARKRRRAQRGMVVIVSLVLLAVMLVLGLASLRLVLHEERMAGQALDRAATFQAAEAALRDVEQRLEQLRPTPAPAGGPCTDVTGAGLSVRACPAPADGSLRWKTAPAAEWSDAQTVGAGALTFTPRYLAEYLGGAFPCGPNPSDPATCKRYRITARAGGTDGRAEVVLESIYATE
ncbi:pilus assembly PilX family protein [Ramlibacter rhizophilus]|uniref:Pilus assembly protein n=1 Tax=Ramlibacter rhizophilus TaxID=1781167 RepID=A0A4Z0BZC5_9BURK|nr:PilX N-terminal domain-containing pilus assembly protein [Ramlibacter rhizophilus]TFZ04656.1 pilus assembly protein [Ramlibacter rhizophilus]